MYVHKTLNTCIGIDEILKYYKTWHAYKKIAFEIDYFLKNCEI